MPEPVVNEIHAREGNTAAVGANYGTINMGKATKLVARFVDVPPLPPHPIVGRDGVLAALRSRLRGDSGVVPTAALDGLPGVGKTTLALRLAYDRELLQHFRAGVLWAGLGPGGDAATALNRLGTALDVDLGAGDAGARARLLSLALQETMRGEPVLLVVDDVWTWEQAEPFLNIAFPGCAHLMTTRNAELARRLVEDATRVATLPDEEAEAFVAMRCPRAREADAAGLAELVRAVGGLPLGLTLIADELRRHEGQESWEGDRPPGGGEGAARQSR